jgi:hypothetical protein
MKTGFLFFITVFIMTLPCSGQQNGKWDKWSFLIGEWQGEGSGQPGNGGGSFSFAFDLDKNVLIRKSHSEYPATETKPKIIHDDLMIVYSDASNNTEKAIYFDNEGHIINYSVTQSDKSIVLTSDKVANAPVFRLTYTFLNNNTVDTRFEMSQDGEKFMTYIEGVSRKSNGK